MDFDKMTYMDLLDKRQEINKAINAYDEREKKAVYTVSAFGKREHYEKPEDAAKYAIETINSELEYTEDLISLFDMGMELKITKYTQAEIDEFVHRADGN